MEGNDYSAAAAGVFAGEGYDTVPRLMNCL
jgi:hypothetical protein